MKLLVGDNRIKNMNKEVKQDSGVIVDHLFGDFTEAANGFADQVFTKGTSLFDFINKRTSQINIMTKPFHIMADIEFCKNRKGASRYFDELSYRCDEADSDVFNGYISDKIRYAILDLMNAVVKQIAYEFDWIDEMELIISFREISKDMYQWSFRLYDIDIIEKLIRAHHDYFGEDDNNMEDHILQMAGPLIEYISTSNTTIVADMIFNVLYDMVFAVADGDTYRIVCDTISEIIIAFKNSLSRVLVDVIIETVKHRRQVAFKHEESLETIRRKVQDEHRKNKPVRDFEE